MFYNFLLLLGRNKLLEVYKITFGEKLKNARLESNYTQEELVNKLCVSRSEISKWESDKGMPDINNLKIISSVLNITIDYLLNEEDNLKLNTTKYKIDLNSYPLLKKKEQKDMAIINKFLEAEIYSLLATEKNTKPENVINELVNFFSPFVDIIPFTKSINNIDNEFYLINDKNKQFLALVTSDYIEIEELKDKVDKNKFTHGNYKFVLCKKDLNSSDS